MIRVAIMQPYFLPYIGYWQLINCVDQFVVYDNIEYTKKGWFNRNRILENDHDRLFTIPLKKDSDFLPVNRRYLSDNCDKEIFRILRIIQNNYKKAQYFDSVYPVIEDCFLFSKKNLFDYIYNAIQIICKFLDIKTTFIVSSSLPIDHTLKAEQKVLAICKQLNTSTYINAIGGLKLYDKAKFADEGIKLQFLKSEDINYAQFNNKFVPWLSIVDVLMFNSITEVNKMLYEHKLI